MHLLVTRPEPDGARTAQALRARGHEPVLCPLLRIEPVPQPAIGPGPWDGIVVTSGNAVRAVAGQADLARLRAVPVLATGRRTAEAARAAGFAAVASADGDLQDLVRLARARVRASGGRLLYLAGEDRSGDLAAELAPAGIAVETVEVYRAVAETALPAPVAAAIAARQVDGVLHYSRRSAETYMRCARAAGLLAAPLVHYCLSAQVAEPLAGAGIADLRVAVTPEERALLDLLRA